VGCISGVTDSEIVRTRELSEGCVAAVTDSEMAGLWVEQIDWGVWQM